MPSSGRRKGKASRQGRASATLKPPSAEDYRVLASNFPKGLVVIMDKDMRILSLEGEVANRLSASKEDLLGRNLMEFLTQDGRGIVASRLDEALRGERVETDIPYTSGLLHVHVIPIMDEEPRWLVVGTDVTHQRSQEEELRASQERLKSVFDHALVGIYRTNPEGEVIMANPALVKLLGFSSFDELQQCNLNTNWLDDQTPRRVFLERIDKEGTVRGMESTWTRKDGQIVNILDSATAIKDPSGRTLYYEGTVENITDIVRYRRRIEELNQSLRVINSILRHDIMNDLNVAIGSLELYRRKGDPKHLETADRTMRKCADLIRKMKELESILSSTALRAMSAREVAREVIGGHSTSPVEIALEGDGLILADEAVVPALDNVISNAIVHGRSDKVRVDICPSPDRAWCDVRVSDHGGGVADEIKQLIFQEGFRYGETGNTGLGLYIVRKTMERYGGSVTVTDNQPHGATFVMRFRSPSADRAPSPPGQ
ncbi:MAG: PAS domain-containing sensor histidine kinase [Methanomassiliicoccales archaeon]|nr:PAS domain-containing sensor histidine kinase [Methanomassiliicoccales archaeon]